MTNIDKVSLDGCCDRHSRRDEMRASARSLSPFEISIAGRGTALSWLEHVGIHREAHTAAGFSPLESCIFEQAVEPLLFGLLFHEAGTGHDHRVNGLRHMFTFR